MTAPPTGPAAVRPEPFDIIVAGAGVAGTCAASALSRDGYAVALVDTRETFPPAFRAEKIGDPQMAFLDGFGLGEAARASVTTFHNVWVHRFGRVVRKQDKREYSSSYGDFVNGLRRGLPAAVPLIVDTITDLSTSAARQQVTLRSGRVLEARLLVLATGTGDALARKIGITRKVHSAHHSLALGFDVTRPPEDFPFVSLVWMSDRSAERMAYFSLFPMGGVMRANLFLYRDLSDPWSKRFRERPGETLHALLPTLEATFGRIEAAGPVQARPVDLTTVDGHIQPGVVLVGDAFFTTCPVTGTGMHKALNDVDRLRQHLPRWLATPGVSAEKVAQFYTDPVKLKVDDRSMLISVIERSVRVDTTPYWIMRRVRRRIVRRTEALVRRVADAVSRHAEPILHRH